MNFSALDGRQRGVEFDENPQKPGRPSHFDHSDFVANLRIWLDYEPFMGRAVPAPSPHQGV